ncbi:MAG: hypothetical protein RI924_712, partial [Bacteroidota bacterium]
YLIFLLVFTLGFGPGIYTYRNLPFVDFLPYKKGADIPELMKIPPGAPQDEYEIIYQLKNKQSGARQQMTDQQYLKQEVWKDTNWEVVGEPVSKLLKKGFEPKIKDLKITDAAGEDFTLAVLEHSGYQLMIIAYDLEKADPGALIKLNALALKAIEEFRIPSAIFTASGVDKAYTLRRNLAINMPFFFVDAIPLKSMVRANPGILLLKNGVVLEKWHYRKLPSYEELVKTYFKK